MDRILAAIREGDFANLALYSHRIRGAGNTIGAKTVGEKAMQLEQAGRNEDMEAAESLIEQVQAEVDRLLSFLAEPDWMEKAKGQK